MSDQTTLKQIQLTAEGLEDLQRELDDLLKVKLPAAIDRVAKTRISEIEEVLAKATVVKHTKSHTHVGMGSQVSIALVKSGKKGSSKTVQIVGEFEANPAENKVSSVSPLGQALMGSKKDDVVKVAAPAGQIEYAVVDVK
jgi:transcription elongation GreA/GreB family factor